ncbi:MAG TPA: cation:proton antiporter [Devosiaceae bacterium]|nr:cation:proton antiporter [Devosiaceae bacterium]
MFEHGFIKELLIVLAVAGLVVPVFGRLRLGVVPGFLIAGALVGPGMLGGMVETALWLEFVTFTDPEEVAPFAELGVLFLLFVVGLEVSLARLWEMRHLVLGLGSAQVLVSAAVIGAIAAAYGNGLGLAAALGLGLALSSTAIVTQLMIDARRLAAPVGRAALAVLLFQDLMVVPIVIVVGLLGGGDPVAASGAWAGALAGAVALAAVVLGVIVVAGRFLLGPLLRLAARGGSGEAVVAIALLVAIGTGLITDMVGLSAALGALLAGLLIGESEYRHQVDVDIAPFKGLLLGLFFMTVGMSFNPSLLATELALVLGSVAALIVIKGAVVFGLALLFRQGPAISVELALVLAGAGEFAFVVLALAGQAGLLPAADQQFFVTVAALSMLATPALGRLGRWIGAAVVERQVQHRHGINPETARFTDHVVIGGFGRVGRTVAEILDAERIPYVALDLDADRVSAESAAGRPVYYGDATRRDILERVGGAHARAFVVTTDAAEAEERMVRAIRSAWPAAVIHARAKDAAHAARLTAVGAASAVPEALEGSLQLAGQVLVAEGLPEEAIYARLARQRDAETARAPAQTTGEPKAGSGA